MIESLGQISHRLEDRNHHFFGYVGRIFDGERGRLLKSLIDLLCNLVSQNFFRLFQIYGHTFDLCDISLLSSLPSVLSLEVLLVKIITQLV